MIKATYLPGNLNYSYYRWSDVELRNSLIINRQDCLWTGFWLHILLIMYYSTSKINAITRLQLHSIFSIFCFVIFNWHLWDIADALIQSCLQKWLSITYDWEQIHVPDPRFAHADERKTTDLLPPQAAIAYSCLKCTKHGQTLLEKHWNIGVMSALFEYCLVN